MDCYQNVMSDNYERCRELLRTLEIPTRSEAVDLLGDPLAGIVFKECQPRELREAFGLEPPLEGPGPELWVSPSDLLIGKVVLKPPLTQKYIQALTHQGILEIGAVIEEKFFNKLEKDKQDCLDKQDKFLRRMFALKLAQEIEKTRRDEHEKCEEQLESLTQYYDEYIQDLIDHMKENLDTLVNQYQEANSEQKEAFENQLKDETERITRELTEEFLNKLQEQETILVRIFTRQLEEKDMKHKCAIDFERVKCKENLIQLKHALECKNISNLMYVLCRERRKCKVEKAAIETEYHVQIDELTADTKDKTVQIEALEEIRARKALEVDTRERCLVEILKQYQKFINYALRAAPCQAEFLLNIDRMMTFEIDDYCVENVSNAERGDETETETAKSASEFEREETIDVVDEDREVEVKVDDLETKSPRTSRTEERREPSDVLPAIYLNDKLYVREDFRDRFANDIGMNPSHELWNQDVEELLKVFRKSITKELDSELRSKSVSYFSSVHFNRFASMQGEAPVIVEEVAIPAEEELIEDEIKVTDTETEHATFHGPGGILKSKCSITNLTGKVPSKTSGLTGSPVSSSIHSIYGTKDGQVSGVRSTSSLRKSRDSNTSGGSGEFKNHARSLLAVTDSLDVIREKKSSFGEGKGRNSLTEKISSPSFVTSTPEKKRASIGAANFQFEEIVPEIQKSMTLSTTKLDLARDSLDIQHETVHRTSQVISDPLKDAVKSDDELSAQLTAEQSESKLAAVHDSLEKIRTTIGQSSIALQLATEMEESQPQKKMFPGHGRKSLVAFIPTATEMKPESKDKLGTIRRESKTLAIPRQGPEFEGLKCVTCKVVGDPDAREGLQDTHEFTKRRVHEFVDLIKDNPSLIRLFTT